MSNSFDSYYIIVINTISWSCFFFFFEVQLYRIYYTDQFRFHSNSVLFGYLYKLQKWWGELTKQSAKTSMLIFNKIVRSRHTRFSFHNFMGNLGLIFFSSIWTTIFSCAFKIINEFQTRLLNILIIKTVWTVTQFSVTLWKLITISN